MDVKGKLKVEGANFDEITRYFRTGWHGQPGQPGTWTSDALAFRITPGENGQPPAPADVRPGPSVFDGAPPAEMMLRYFQIGRPMVLAYANADGGGHAVVAYGGDFDESPGSIAIKTIRIYDPLEGTEASEEWRFFGRRLIGAWFPTISLRDGCNVFTLGQAPDPRCQSPVRGEGVPIPPAAPMRRITGPADMCVSFAGVWRAVEGDLTPMNITQNACGISSGFRNTGGGYNHIVTGRILGVAATINVDRTNPSGCTTRMSGSLIQQPDGSMSWSITSTTGNCDLRADFHETRRWVRQ